MNTALYRFEKKNDKQLYLRRMVLNERADTSGVIFPAYRKSNVQGIVMAFDVRAYANEEYEIDVTDWLQSDTDLLYFSATARGVLRLGGQQRDKSEVLSVRAYDRNVEIRTQNLCFTGRFGDGDLSVTYLSVTVTGTGNDPSFTG